MRRYIMLYVTAIILFVVVMVSVTFAWYINVNVTSSPIVQSENIDGLTLNLYRGYDFDFNGALDSLEPQDRKSTDLNDKFIDINYANSTFDKVNGLMDGSIITYRLVVNNIPEGTNTSKGTPVRALVEMETGEDVSTIYSIYRDTDAKYVLFVTKNGLVKKTALSEYIGTKKSKGIGAINIKDGDELAIVTLIKDEPLLIVSKNGYAIKFNSDDISATGRLTAGVKGINLGDNDKVIAALPIRHNEDDLAIFSSKGYGKKIKLNDISI